MHPGTDGLAFVARTLLAVAVCGDTALDAHLEGWYPIWNWALD